MRFRRTVSRVLGLTALALLVGAVTALLWANVSVLPRWTVYPDGHAELTDLDRTQVFSATFWYSVLALLAGGLALGVAAWARGAAIGWPVAVITGALACRRRPDLLVAGRRSSAPARSPSGWPPPRPGDQVAVALRLQAPSALAIWVFAAVAVPLFAASLGPEMDATARLAPAVEPDGRADRRRCLSAPSRSSAKFTAPADVAPDFGGLVEVASSQPFDLDATYHDTPDLRAGRRRLVAAPARRRQGRRLAPEAPRGGRGPHRGAGARRRHHPGRARARRHREVAGLSAVVPVARLRTTRVRVGAHRGRRAGGPLARDAVTRPRRPARSRGPRSRSSWSPARPSACWTP